MAHISFFKPVVDARLNQWAGSATLRTTIHKQDAMGQTGAVTLLNVKVLHYRQVHIPSLYSECGTILANAILVDLDEGDRIEGDLPLGFSMTTVWVKEGSFDRPYRAIHMCPLHIANLIDFSVTENLMVWSEEKDGEESSYSHTEVCLFPDQLIDARINGEGNLRKHDARQYMRVVADIRDDADCSIEVADCVRKGLGHCNTHRISPVRLVDSLHPSMGGRYLSCRSENYYHSSTLPTLADVAKEYRKDYTESGIVPVDGLDDNVLSGHLNFFRKALRTDKSSTSIAARDKVKTGGRWVVLDEEPLTFPDATRCNTYWGREFLAFKIDRHAGTYGVIPNMKAHENKNGVLVDDKHPSFWKNNDYMLIHHRDDLWRFIFVCHFSVGVRLGQHVNMTAIIPYTVEERECAKTLRTITPQRGMPREVSKAIQNAPFCASAISHATSRLKYLSSALPMLRKEYQYGDFTAHRPDLPVLFRPRQGVRPVVTGTHTTNRSGVTKCLNEDRFYVDDLLEEEIGRFPETDIRWSEKRYVSDMSVLGHEHHNVRALCLDD